MSNALSPNDRMLRDALLRQVPADLKVDGETLLPRLGRWRGEKGSRDQIGWLNKAHPVLTACLAPGEVIRVVTFAMVNHTWETFMMGVWAYTINRTLVVLTDQRLILIHTNGKANPESFINAIPLAHLKEVKAGLLGNLTVKTQKKTLILTGVSKADAKAIAGLIPKNKAAQGGILSLCPACFDPSEGFRGDCPACHTPIKSVQKAALRSLILPGLGDWYLGHRTLAAMEMFGGLIVWAVALGAILGGMESGEGEAIAGGLIILALANGADALLTRAQAKKGRMSESGQLPAPRGDARAVGGRGGALSR